MKAKKWHFWGEKPRALQWRQFWLIIGVNKIANRIHCAASKVDETWWKYSFTMDYYVEVQHLGEPPVTRP